ncbi:MAG TPA: class I SAM-dependent methyltransferase [Gammaproteobacteria bacterium]|nr:class I SAM-dependent methyltransferase [Gammaproteobacteria bacterium]
MSRDYQYDFSASSPYVYDVENRERKARTMAAVLEDFLPGPLDGYDLLNVGGSAGIIDNYLAHHFKSVAGIDIDKPAIEHAQSHFQRDNLRFQVADALNLPFGDESFDVVICSHVYEHVPDPERMFDEIFRVLRKDGICYFSAGNRLMWNEPHYNLPLLSVLPRPLAHVYIRLAGKARFYHEKHLSYWGLKTLVRRFAVTDYTRRLVVEPEQFHTDYMLRPGSAKARIAGTLLSLAYWAFPGYIWLLQKQ